MESDSKTGFFRDRYDKTGKEIEKPVHANIEELSGLKKAAIVMISLGHETSSKIFQNLDEGEIERLSTEIARFENVPTAVREAVLDEFHTLCLAQQYINQGGIDYARKVLESSVGPKKAKDILDKIKETIRTTGFNLLENIDSKQLVNFMQKEHPQTIALLLAHIDSKNAAPIISALPPELQVDVASRIATMESIAPETLEQVEEVLLNQIKSMFGSEASEIGGIKSVAELLNNMDRGAVKNILGNLERENPQLATDIKNLMFVFEDILLLDDRSMQRMLKEVDTKDLSMALKGASEDLQAKFFRNMSSRAAEMIREDIEYMGPIRVKQVEEVQQKVVDIVRRLEEDGEIIISGHGGEEAVIV
jgi:flagellar motor switch protein FliG